MTKNFFFFNGCFDKNRIKSLISWSLQHCGDEITINLLENLKTLGFTYATQAGISLGIDDLKIPPTKTQLIYDSDLKIQLGQVNFKQGYLTGLEKFQQLIDTWHKTSEILKQNVINYFKITDVLNPVYMMAFSGARGNISQVRQLVGMRGLMADPQGQILDFPIKSNFREGLTLTEYLISCYGARKGLVDTALKTANAGYLTRRLVDVSHHIIVCEFDCKTNQSIVLNDILENQKIIIPLQNRLVGRILAENIYINQKNLKLKSLKKKIFSSGSLKPSTGFYDCAPSEAVKQRSGILIDDKNSRHFVDFKQSLKLSKPAGKSLTELKFKKVVFLKKIKNNARILALFSKFLLFYFFCKSQKWIWNKKQQQYFPAKSINKVIFFVLNFNSKKLQKIFCDPLMVFWKIIYFKSIKKKTQLIATKNQEISFNLSVKIAKFKNQVKVRSPLTCEIKNSICQLCYGWSLAQGKLVSLGEAVGIIAGQSIGEPGTQLTMRTFHTGGVFSGEILTEIKAPFDGIIEFSDCLQGKLIRTPHGKIAFLTKVAGTFNFYQKQFFSSKADFHKVKTALTELKFNDCTKRKPVVVGDSHQPQLENFKKTSFQIPAFTILFHRNYEYVKKSHIIAEFSGDNNTESQEEPLYGTYDLKSEMEGELFFKYVVYDRKIKTKTKEIISSTTSKLGSIWVLSGKSLKQPIFIETFPQSGDLIDQNSIIGQYKTMLPGNGFITILPKNLTKILSNENRFTKTITNNLQLKWNYNFNKLNEKKSFAVGGENLPQAFTKHNLQPLTSPNPIWLSSKFKLIQTSAADNNLTKFNFYERVKQPLIFSQKNQKYNLVVKKSEKKTNIVNLKFEKLTDKKIFLNHAIILFSLFSIKYKKFGYFLSFCGFKNSTLKKDQFFLSNSLQQKFSNLNKLQTTFFFQSYPEHYKTQNGGKVICDDFYVNETLQCGEIFWILEQNYKFNLENLIFLKNKKNLYKTQKLNKIKVLKNNNLNLFFLKKNKIKYKKKVFNYINKSNPLIFYQNSQGKIFSLYPKLSGYLKINLVDFFFLNVNSVKYVVSSTQLEAGFHFLEKEFQQNSNRFAKISSGNLNKGNTNVKPFKSSKTIKKNLFLKLTTKKNSFLKLTTNYLNNYSLLFSSESEFLQGKNFSQNSSCGLNFKRCLNRFAKISPGNLSESTTTPGLRKPQSNLLPSFFEKSIYNFENLGFTVNYIHSILNLIKINLQSKITSTSTNYARKFFINKFLHNKYFYFAQCVKKNKKINNKLFKKNYLSALQPQFPHIKFSKLYSLKSLVNTLFFTEIHFLLNFSSKSKFIQGKNFSQSSNKVGLRAKQRGFFQEKISEQRLNFEAQSNFSASYSLYYEPEKSLFFNIVQKKFLVLSDKNVSQQKKKYTYKSIKAKQFYSSKNSSNRHTQKVQIKIQPGWIYFPRNFKQVIQKNKNIIKPGLILCDTILFDQSFIFFECLLLKKIFIQNQKTLVKIKKNNLKNILKFNTTLFDFYANNQNKNFSNTLLKNTFFEKNIFYKTFFNSLNKLFLKSFILLFNQNFTTVQTLIFTKFKQNLNKIIFKKFKLRFNKRLFKRNNLLKNFDGVKISRSNIYNALFKQLKLKKYIKKNKFRAKYIFCPRLDCAPKFKQRLNFSKPTTKAFYTTKLKLKKLATTKSQSINYNLKLSAISNCEKIYFIENVLQTKISNQLQIYEKVKNCICLKLAFASQKATKGQKKNLFNLPSNTNDFVCKTLFISTQFKHNGIKNFSVFNRNLFIPKFFILIRKLKPYSFISSSYYKKLLAQQNKSELFFYNSFNNFNTNFLNFSKSVNLNKQKTTPLFSNHLATDFSIVPYLKYKENTKHIFYKNITIIDFSIRLSVSQNYFIRTTKIQLLSKSLMNRVNLKLIKKRLKTNNKSKLNIAFLINQRNKLTFNSILYFNISMIFELKFTNFVSQFVPKESQLVQTYANQQKFLLRKNFSQNKVIKASYNSLLLSSQNFISNQTLKNLTKFFSSYQGEILNTNLSTTEIQKSSCGEATTGLCEAQSLVLTNQDQKTFYTGKLINTQISVLRIFLGKLVFYGDKIYNLSPINNFSPALAQNYKNFAIPESGQVIQIDKSKITLRKAQPILFSSRGALSVRHGDIIAKNSLIIRLFYKLLKTGDIIQGIPKIEQLLEARKTSQGEPIFNSIHMQLDRLFSKYQDQKNYDLQKAVRESFKDIQQIIVNNVQKVYQSQGVRIAEKHFEIIIRQMTSKVEITIPGKTNLIAGELVDLDWIEIVNKAIPYQNNQAIYKPVILGITKKSLNTQSFISEVSFQETTRILTKSAIEGRTDFLKGLKENVILGHLIPAGTGFNNKNKVFNLNTLNTLKYKLDDDYETFTIFRQIFLENS